MGNQIITQIGDVYGRLTVLEQAKSKNGRAMWICSCSCGSEPRAYRGDPLRSGRSTSCGCNQREATSRAARASAVYQVHKGDRFGLLTVIGDEPVSRMSKGQRRLYWLCQCDCGSEPKYFRKDSFFHKKDEAEVKNCGCLTAKIRAAALTTHGLSHTRAKKNEYLANYRARKSSAQPDWAAKAVSSKFIELSIEAEQQKALGLGFFQIDHIVPLNGKTRSNVGVPVVCGLHVHYNLRLITRHENIVKGCRIWPDMPEYTDADIAQLRILAEQTI